jgi:hypothetical protein
VIQRLHKVVNLVATIDMQIGIILGILLIFLYFEEHKAFPRFSQSVLTRRVGFSLKFYEFDKGYRTKICF